MSIRSTIIGPKASASLDDIALDETVASLRSSLRNFDVENSLEEQKAEVEREPTITAFNASFTSIIATFLIAANYPAYRNGVEIHKTLRAILRTVSASPSDAESLIRLCLQSVPKPISHLLGGTSYTWDTFAGLDKNAMLDLSYKTGIYALSFKNPLGEHIYVGQTTRSFQARWLQHLEKRKATKLPKANPSSFYGHLKFAKPRYITGFVLADTTILKEDWRVEKVVACVLEAAFCVLLDSMRVTNMARSATFESGVDFANAWYVLHTMDHSFGGL